jgi:hypothetical protein
LVMRLRQSGLHVTTEGAQPTLRRAARILHAEDELGLT